ncbi:hypothetical protein QCD70_09795 [Agreia sp. PsM10]|uniref:hypothetical protein n=1 Tax=Agreia sp. PsM10 TaxID=3030533 RepID=UPI00263A8A53|nr:hypothetical protein [Agreia sp. PsM10]MDN4640534.1 hypothetical protein [Agreia sp. PsM10]
MASRRKTDRKRKRPVDSPEAVSLFITGDAAQRAVDEGLLIARFAVVMEVKNHIIVNALRHDAPFDPQVTALEVRQSMARLADEQAGYAERVTAVLKTRAARARGSVKHEHDYHPEDLATLDLRHAVNLRLAEKLRQLSADDGYVGEIVETARQDAWGELGGAVESRLDRLPKPPVKNADYDRNRARRIRTLIDVDLAALKKQMDDI